MFELRSKNTAMKGLKQTLLFFLPLVSALFLAGKSGAPLAGTAELVTVTAPGAALQAMQAMEATYVSTPVNSQRALAIMQAMENGITTGVDVVGGVGLKKELTVDGIFSTYGGVNNEFILFADAPAVIIAYTGQNTFRIKKVSPFSGEVLCIRAGGFNVFAHCREISFEDYRLVNTGK
ncbi:MAG: hypothetical protein HYU99_08700 [Deltaproteobacteria bacterium]|nr:hypothetical protein [Deltaproteobacteria bacterium]